MCITSSLNVVVVMLFLEKKEIRIQKIVRAPICAGTCWEKSLYKNVYSRGIQLKHLNKLQIINKNVEAHVSSLQLSVHLNNFLSMMRWCECWKLSCLS